MTSLFSELFAGGTNGAAITTANTNFTNSVSPGAWTFSNAHVIAGYGSLAGRATATSGTALANAGNSAWSSTAIVYLNLPLYVESLPTSNTTIMSFRNGATSVGDLRITTSGALQIRNGGFVQVAISGNLATAGKAARVQVKYDSTAGKMQLRVFAGTNVSGATPDYDSGTVTATGLQALTNFQVGLVSSTTATVHFSAVQFDNAAFPGPAGNAPPTCTASASPNPVSAGASFTLTGTDSDPDGTIVTRAWTPATGLTGASTATATGTAPSVPGGTTQTYTYTVTDNVGATASSTVTLTTLSSTASIALRGSTQTTNTGTALNTTVTVPSSVLPGDKLLAIFFDGGGSLTQSFSTAGWLPVAASAVSTSNIGLHMWQKTAVAGDASSALTVSSSLDGSTVSKRTFVVAAFAGARLGNASGVLATTAATAHVAPGQVAASANAWVVNIFADRGSPGSTGFTLPGNLTVLQHFEHTGGAAVSSVVAYDDLVGAGTVGGNTATGTLSTANAVMATVILEPGTGNNPPPTVVPGADQTGVEPWSQFTVGGVDVAQGTATIASIVWTQLQGDDLGDLSSLTTGTITLTAPADVFGTSLILQKTVTDSTGAFASDQVQVDVLPVTERGTSGGIEVPMRLTAI